MENFRRSLFPSVFTSLAVLSQCDRKYIQAQHILIADFICQSAGQTNADVGDGIIR